MRQHRKLFDLTQQQLVNEIGCSGITIRKIDSGDRKPSQTLAENLSMILQVPEWERDAFIRFARLDSEANSFLVSAWGPERPSWRTNQLPQKHPEMTATHDAFTLQYTVVAAERSTYTDAGDGRYLFIAKAEGHTSGSIEVQSNSNTLKLSIPNRRGLVFHRHCQCA